MDLNDCEVLLAPRSVFNARILISDHQNPDLLFRNPDFLLKNLDVITKQRRASVADWCDFSRRILISYSGILISYSGILISYSRILIL